MKPHPRRGARASILLGLWTIASLLGCGLSEPPQSPPGSVNNPVVAPQGALEIVFAYGSEKKSWVTAVTAEFNQGGFKSDSGKPIFVRAVPLGSGELIAEVSAGRLQSHVVSPASAAFIVLGNAESTARTGKPLVGETENLVLSPVVIAMWKPMAEALGWGKKPVGWSDVLEVAADPQGWAKHGFPQWGAFKFGHTHPEYSNSGLISLFAEVYAGAGKVNNLTLADLQRPEVGDFLGKIEQSVVHYGSSTGFFGDKMFAGGPSYLSAAVLYENMVLESGQAKTPLPFPVVAIYPKEGTFWSDHPVGVVEREWVTPEHRSAAKQYTAFLMKEPQQRKAMELGFRPGDARIPLGAPIDAAHGVDPREPQTTLEVPSAAVMNGIVDLWRQRKKHANVVLVLDVSGSMHGAMIENAKLGGLSMVEMMKDEDQLTLVSFNDKVMFAGKNMPLATARPKAKQVLESYFASGGTALYDGVAASYSHLQEHPAPNTISAIVVLSDGGDTNSHRNLAQLLDQIRSDNETKTIRVFTIGYGSGSKADILQQISDSTNAKYFPGSPETIREVFKEISTFF